MKIYKTPQLRIIQLDPEQLIAQSGTKMQYTDEYADNNLDALSSKRETIWADEESIWK